MKINKDGSLIKYLRYALGEVLLVVIGILIAVSLNNWNKNRVKEKSFKGVVKNLVDDIKNDTALAGKYIRYYSENEKFFKIRINMYFMCRDSFNPFCDNCPRVIDRHLYQ